MLFSPTHTGADVPLSRIGQLSKEERKERLRKMVVGKHCSLEESWRSGEGVVAIKGSLEDIHDYHSHGRCRVSSRKRER